MRSFDPLIFRLSPNSHSWESTQCDAIKKEMNSEEMFTSKTTEKYQKKTVLAVSYKHLNNDEVQLSNVIQGDLEERELSQTF